MADDYPPNPVFERTLADLRDVFQQPPQFDESVSLRRIQACFDADPALTGVLILRAGELRGVISRAWLARQMTRPFFPEVFRKLPVASMLETFRGELLALHESVTIREAIQFALRRAESQTYEPVVVLQDQAEPGLLVMHRLLLEQCQALTEAARESERERDSAGASARAKGEFLANMSHEIRTPLTAILGFAELLMDPESEGIEREQQIRTILRNGEHLLRVLDDILDLSKIEAGRLQIRASSCDVQALLEEVRELFEPRAVAKGIELVGDWGELVPARVSLDAQRLRQILFNLLSNAIKFTDRGAVTLGCRYLRTEGQDELEFLVADTGIGIPAGSLAALFQPFQQVDGTARRLYGGTGLGLAISRRLSVLMGGSLTIASEQGLGTRFTLRLPCFAAPDPSPSLIEGTIQRAVRSIRGARVLVADDGRDNQLLVGTYLRRAGYEFQVVGDGRSAVELLTGPKAQPFDLLLLDMQMPVLDGYAAAAELRQRGWDGPIVALTANAMAGDRERCLEAGCDEHVSKPIDRERLLGAVREWIERGVRPALPSSAVGTPAASSSVRSAT